MKPMELFMHGLSTARKICTWWDVHESKDKPWAKKNPRYPHHYNNNNLFI